MNASPMGLRCLCRLRHLRIILLRVSVLVAMAAFASSFAVAAEAVPKPDASAESIRIAIAPFEGETAAVRVSEALSEGLAIQPLGRLIPPDAFVSGTEFEPPAAQVRQWAYNAAVDAVVVGRLREALPIGRGWEVEAVVRSGHSGAEVSRHSTSIATPAELRSVSENLAREILASLGLHQVSAPPPPGSVRDPRSPEPARLVLREEGSEPLAPIGNDEGLSAGFDLGSLGGNSPIEIKADEAEIVDRGEGRTLVFQRNVRVRQGDITLESDRLEAQYQKGQSEPDRLVARGDVAVGQGHRRAQCDRAVYLRVEQRLSCEGRAELLQGCDIVRGDSIEFDLASEKARVVGAASIVIRPGEATDHGCELPEDLL